MLKSKLVGNFLLFWGATFVLRSIADFEYYIYSWGAEALVETATWLIYDIAGIAAGIILFMIAAKI